MPKATKAKKVAATPYSGNKAKKDSNPLIESKKKNLGIGGDVQPKRNLSRMVKWPRYVRLQRQKRIINQRLKVPPGIAQFAKTADKNLATQALLLMMKYRPEERSEKKERLKKLAAERADGAEAKTGKKPLTVKYGLNHVTTLIENKQAALVVIAHDVDPIEIVMWLPALCRKMDVPYLIVKGKSRLGSIVHKKTATALALTAVEASDRDTLAKFVELARGSYNEKYSEISRTWGGGVMGVKSQAKTMIREKAVAREAAKKAATQ